MSSEAAPTRRLTAAFLVVSFLLSLAILSVRNLYDDEHSNFNYVGMTVGHVIQVANMVDVHPPGQYVLTNLAYRLIPSPRWETLVPLALLYLGLGLFVRAVTPLYSTLRQQVCFLLLATLHPQLLMWGNTVRWYSWWTGLALVAIVVALRPGVPDVDGPSRLSIARAAGVGVLLAGLFYLNYITLLLLPCLLAAMLLRFRPRAWGRLGVVCLVFAVLVAPQLHPMLAVHMHGAHRQQGPPLVAAVRLLLGLLGSEAYLPWHPLALGSLLVFTALLVALVREIARPEIARRDAPGRMPKRWAAPKAIATIQLLFLPLAALLVLTGLAAKARSGLLLVPLLATLAASALGYIRPVRRQSWVLVFLAVWSLGGNVHLLTRGGLAKASMIDHPEELIAAVRAEQSGSTATPCIVFVTYDTPLALALVTARLDGSEILSTHQYALFNDAPKLPPECPDGVEVLWIRTYTDESKAANRKILDEMARAAAALPAEPGQQRFSHDPDAAMKRRLARFTGVANLPDDRILVTRSRIPLSAVPLLLRSLPHFAPADGHSQAESGL